MKLTSESKFFLGIIAVSVILIGGAALLLSKPTPPVTIPRETLITADTNTYGSASASATLVEFSDFQCPACKAYAPTLEGLRLQYGNVMQFAYHHFPLPQHEMSKPAAYAAEAAAKQGKFWEAEKILFENQEQFSDEFFATQFAQLLQLDQSRYNTDRKSQEVADKIDRELALGNQIGISATPTFYLNGVKLTNISPAELAQKVAEAVGQR